MKKTRKALALLAALCLLLAAAGSGAETYVDYISAGGQVPDRTVYTGDWQAVYLDVLAGHSGRIHAYQAVPFEWDGEDSRLLPCFPVAAETDVSRNLFDNPEINAMIDANHAEVAEKGWRRDPGR